METRAHHTIVGAFVLTMLLGIFIAVIWLAGTQFENSAAIYDIYFSGSVSGLSDGAPVRYKGIPIGRVASIRLDPDNVERIRVRIEVDPNTPIKADAVASLELAGLTGQAVVQISGGSNGSPELEAAEGQSYPIIASRPSQLEEVVNSAPQLLQKATQAADRLLSVLGDDNLKALAGTLQHLDTATGVIASHSQDLDRLISETAGLAGELHKTAIRANAMMTELDQSVNAKDGIASRVSTSLEDFDKSARSLAKMTDSLGALVAENRVAFHDFSQRGLPQTEQLLTDSRALVAELTRIAEQLERDPARFLLGDRRQGYQPR